MSIKFTERNVAQSIATRMATSINVASYFFTNFYAKMALLILAVNLIYVFGYFIFKYRLDHYQCLSNADRLIIIRIILIKIYILNKLNEQFNR